MLSRLTSMYIHICIHTHTFVCTYIDIHIYYSLSVPLDKHTLHADGGNLRIWTGDPPQVFFVETVDGPSTPKVA